MSSAQCSAISNALNAKGYDNAQLANKVGLSTQRIDSILSGSVKPTQQEFSAIAGALGLPGNSNHAAQVTV